MLSIPITYFPQGVLGTPLFLTLLISPLIQLRLLRHRTTINMAESLSRQLCLILLLIISLLQDLLFLHIPLNIIPQDDYRIDRVRNNKIQNNRLLVKA
jgi:hypothetical protein